MLSTPTSKLASLALKAPMGKLKDKLDPDTYGGAPLLGIDGVCMIGHGSSGDRAITAAIRASAHAVRQDLTGSIAESIAG